MTQYEGAPAPCQPGADDRAATPALGPPRTRRRGLALLRALALYYPGYWAAAIPGSGNAAATGIALLGGSPAVTTAVAAFALGRRCTAGRLKEPVNLHVTAIHYDINNETDQ
jgi:hypothetical protein